MDILKKIWPYSFTAKKDIAALIIAIVIHIVGGVIIGFLVSLLTSIPLLGFIFKLIGSLLGVYLLVGIVLLVLDYFKILK